MNKQIRKLGALVAGGALLVGGMLVATPSAFANSTDNPNGTIYINDPSGPGAADMYMAVGAVRTKVTTSSVTGDKLVNQAGGNPWMSSDGTIATAVSSSLSDTAQITAIAPGGPITISADWAQAGLGTMTVTVNPAITSIALQDSNGNQYMTSGGSDTISVKSWVPQASPWAQVLSTTYNVQNLQGVIQTDCKTAKVDPTTGVLTATTYDANTACSVVVAALVDQSIPKGQPGNLNGQGVTATIRITVLPSAGVSFTGPTPLDAWALLPGQSFTPTISAVNPIVTTSYTSSNTAVATVSPASGNGPTSTTVTAHSAGTTNICVTVTDNAGGTSTACNLLTVLSTPITDVWDWTPQAMGLTIGGSSAITTWVEDANGNILPGAGLVQFVSNSTYVAKVDANGVVTGVGGGSTTIDIVIPAAETGTGSPIVYKDAVQVTVTGSAPSACPTFSDVPASNIFSGDICWAALTGVTVGTGNNTFSPTALTTRAQMAAFLYNLAGKPTVVPPKSSPFADVAEGSTYYTPIIWLYEAGITTGYTPGADSNFYGPNDVITRGQIALMLMRMADDGGVVPPATPVFTDVPSSSLYFAAAQWMYYNGITSGIQSANGLTYQPGLGLPRQQMVAFLHRVTELSTMCSVWSTAVGC
jgi:hypothetical protein